MKVLTLTTLYPHAGAPHHGVFVENRLTAMAARGHEVRVVAPVPWFPSAHPRFGAYAAHAAAPRREVRRGIPIEHPRYALPPRTAMSVAPSRLTKAFLTAARRLIADGFEPDLIDAHYYYPDGVAAAAVAKALGLPFVCTARGTDVNLIPRYPAQRQAVLAATEAAEHTITVADALRDELVSLGADPHRVTTLRNGVDLDRFSPGDREAARAGLDLGGGPVIASVGHLTERKGHHLVIGAMEALPDATLLIAGTGEEKGALEALAAARGVADRVRFLGAVPHDELARVYRAADVLVLASSREGWPNVLLEAMACGTPCVATPVWGSGEVIATPAAGRLAEDRTEGAVAAALTALLADPPDRAETRRYAEGFGWGPVAEGVEKVWRAAARRSAWGMPLRRRAKAEPPLLLLTVDTEEAFTWGEDGRWDEADAVWTVPPPCGLDALQTVARRHGVSPLYLATHPIMTDDRFGGALARLVEDGQAEAGLHLHSFSTPPGGAPCSGPPSFQRSLPPDLHAAKLDALIDAFRTRFGHEPACHRAGRYGVAPWVLDQLAERGVCLDLSPAPPFGYLDEGGPDFSLMEPRERNRDGLMVVPVSGGRRWRKGAYGAPPPGLTGAREMASKHLAWPVRLTPENVSLATMKSLARHLAGQGVHVLTPSLHSSSLTPGATRYAPDLAARDAQLARLDGFLRWAVAEGYQPVTASGLRRILKARAEA